MGVLKNTKASAVIESVVPGLSSDLYSSLDDKSKCQTILEDSAVSIGNKEGKFIAFTIKSYF